MAEFLDWISSSWLGQLAPEMPVPVTLLVFLWLFGAAAAASLLPAAAVLWAVTRVHPLLDAKLWRPAVKAFAFFSAGAPTKTWAVIGYFSLWFVAYYLYALKVFSGASLLEIASSLGNVGIQAIYALPYLLIFAIFVFVYRKWDGVRQTAERRWPKAALFAFRVLEVVRFFLWGWMGTRWGAGLLTALAGLCWVSAIVGMFGDDRLVIAAAITVLCFVVAIALGIGLSGLHAALKAQGKPKTLNAMRTYFSFGIVLLLSTVQLFIVCAGQLFASSTGTVEITAEAVIEGSVLTAIIFLTLAAPFALGWRLQSGTTTVSPI